MSEVGTTEQTRVLQSRRHESSSIVTSRKRKLRELFAVATQVESIPNPILTNPDAPTTTPAEWQFLQASDISRGKVLLESNIPQRSTLSLDILKKSLAKAAFEFAETLKLSALEEEKRKKNSVPDTQGEPKSDESKSDGPRQDGPKHDKKPTPAKSNSPNILQPQGTPTPKAPLQALPVAPTPSVPLQPVSTAPSTPNGLKPALKPALTPTLTNSNPTKLVSNEASKAQVQLSAPNGVQHVALPRQTPVALPLTVKVPVPAPAPTKADLPVDTKPAPAVSAPATNVAKPLSIKPPEPVKAPDALSSPGSTAQSATTPAVHDVSADTSPENEGPQYQEPTEEKSKQDVPPPEKTEPSRVVDEPADDLKIRAMNAPPDSAEAQLLQESIRSNEAALNAKSEPKAPTPVLEPKDVEMSGAADAVTDDVAEPSVDKTKTIIGEPSSAKETQQKPSAEMAESEGKEIPDSQEEGTDHMELDNSEAAGGVQEKETISAETVKKENLANDAPSTPVSANKSHQEILQASERAVTRVTSGAMRPKSVSEIVGETPRLTPTLERTTTTTKRADSQLTPITSTPQSPSIRQRNHAAHRRERSRSQPSTVVFGNKPKRVDEKSMVPKQPDAIQPTDDYYTPLFVQGFAGSSSWMQPIEKILFHANKTLASPDVNLAIQDHQACKVLRRVYHLQQTDKWSLRQPKRCPEPTRPPSQWDVMMQEMKWMRTDFREERKWKRAVAKNLAYACAEWHDATPEERKSLQVPARIPAKHDLNADVSMVHADGDGVESQFLPDLIPGDVDSPIENVDELVDNFVETIVPSAIFALEDEDVVFGLRRTPTADRLLEELPMYGSPLAVPKFDLTGPEYDPDAHWRRPALPLSKYVEGQMKLVCDGPPRKRSRYDYQNEDSDDENVSVFHGNKAPPSNLPLPSQTDEVALFNPELRPIRDRLHAGHQFRPPSEHPMPNQGFYECRSSSQWTLAEDDELRCLVREHSYNWSLISSLLSTKSLFVSGAERRTPWECFERWINLEGLPADMQKTHYFKAYNTRIEAAQRAIMQQNQIAAQQASANGSTVVPPRRRPSIPMRVERRRNQKHLALIDSMRKLAKKRETAIQKQQHSASQNAANKKNNDPVARGTNKTPRDYSLLRWERDQALAEKMAQYAQRQEAQRRAALQARQSQVAQMAGNQPGAQAGQNSTHPPAAAAVNGMNAVGRVNMPNQLAAAAAAAAAAGQGRPRVPMQSPAPGMGSVPAHMAGGLVPPTPMNGVQQAQMQAALQAAQQNRMPMPNPQPDVNLMMRAQRISEQQRAAVQMQQTQPGPGTPSQVTTQQSPPPNMRTNVNGVNGVNAMAQQNLVANQAMMASYNANNNTNNTHSAPQANGLHMPTGQAGSPVPRVPQVSAALVNQLNQLEAQFRAKHPTITPEQARHLATEHLTRAMLAQRQSAMNAAAGANSQPGLAAGIAATTSPHQYAALLRQQQQAQASQAAGSPAPQHQQQQSAQQVQQAAQHQRQASGSATPSIGN